MDIIGTIIWGILRVLFTLLAFYASLLFVDYLHNLKEKIGKERWQALMEIARSVVKAMEQIYGSGSGALKKQEAIKYLTKYLRISEEEADKLIEAAVFELNNLWNKIQGGDNAE